MMYIKKSAERDGTLRADVNYAIKIISLLAQFHSPFPIASTIKKAIVWMAIHELISGSLAETLIRRGGLSNA